MTRLRRGRATTDESLAWALRHTDLLPADELGQLWWLAELDPALGGLTDEELAPFGGRAAKIADLVSNLAHIARQDAAVVEHVRFRTRCHCAWCDRRRCTLLSLGDLDA